MTVENKAIKHKCYNTPNVLYVLKTRRQSTHVRHHAITNKEEDAHFGSVII